MDMFNGKSSSNPDKRIKEEGTETLEPKPSTEETLLVLLDEIELLREQIESWRSFVAHQNQELEALDQELNHTNQELLDALKFQHTSLTEVKQIAKTILASKKSPSECLAELISTLYGFPVKSEELTSPYNLTPETQPVIQLETHNLIAESKQLRTHLKNIRLQLSQLRSQYAVFKYNSQF